VFSSEYKLRIVAEYENARFHDLDTFSPFRGRLR